MSILGGGKNKPQNSSANPDQQEPPVESVKGEGYVHTPKGEHPMTDAQIADMLCGEDD